MLTLNTSDKIAIAALIVAFLALCVAIQQYLVARRQVREDNAKLRIKLELADEQAAYGLIVHNKDHLLVSALNVGRRPIVLQEIKLDLALRWPYWFQRMQFSGGTPLDGPNSYFSGSSYAEPSQVDPGFTFKMLLNLPATVLVEHRKLKEVQVVDSLGQIHTATWLEMFLIRRALRKQREEWRARYGFRNYQVASDDVPNTKESSQPESTD